MNLSSNVSELKGIGPKKTKALKKLGIETIFDCLYFFPRTYQDRSKVMPINECIVDENVLIEGMVVSKRYVTAGKKSILKLSVNDGTDNIQIAFFNGRYIKEQILEGNQYSFYGKISFNKGIKSIVQPDFALKGSESDFRGIVPVYPLTEGITQKDMLKLQNQVSRYYELIEEWIPEDIISTNRLAGLVFSISNMHFPKGKRELLQAKFRLIYEELLVFQMGILLNGRNIGEENNNFSLPASNEDEIFIENLPFKLTGGQISVWNTIKEELFSNKRMNRLVQGDVGSGKTIIAELAMFVMAKGGYQSVMMAPTELLAKQHAENIERDLAKYGIKTALLCGSMSKKEKELVLGKLKAGEIHVLIGTHALIQPSVQFYNLGLVITDEQHRFGVEQRMKLQDKGYRPNLLVMTATPIPRTLAVILYGNLDISVIDTMPSNRKKIKTFSIESKDRNNVYEKVLTEIKAGRQAYVVTPLIEESDAVDALSATEVYSELKGKFKAFTVEIVHGDLRQEEKDRAMSAFASGKVDVLVSTVVVEVGINVPNATIMVIENCERFGLAQLHQLRGRVGRGSQQSYCFLVGNLKNDIAKKRVETMCKTDSGFVIAEEDLLQRGPGELFGTRQHGLPELHLADILKHINILEQVKLQCEKILKEDANLKSDKYAVLKLKIIDLFGKDLILTI